MHFSKTHLPFPLQFLSQGLVLRGERWEQSFPKKPGWHKHLPLKQIPLLLQSFLQLFLIEQSLPEKPKINKRLPESQKHFPNLHSPLLLQLLGHVSFFSHFSPENPKY
jgi:hypothetical protein